MSEPKKRNKRKQDISVREVDPDPKILRSNGEALRRQEERTEKKTIMSVLNKKPQKAAGQQSMKSFLTVKTLESSSSSCTTSNSIQDSGLEAEATTLEADLVQEVAEPVEPCVDLLYRELDQMPKLTREPTFKMPTYLQKYFRYEGHVDNKNKRKTIMMTCLRCSSDPTKQGCKNWYLGAPYSNFKDHLWRDHTDEYAAEAEKGNAHGVHSRRLASANDVPITEALRSDSWIAPTNVNTYSGNHPIQKRFESDILDCVSIDMMPMEVLQKPCVAKMIRNIDPKLRLFSRRTIGRRLCDFYEKKFKPRNVQLAERVADGCFHLILDLWTDRQKTSILGIKAQFITTDWKLQNRVLAFRHFAGHHYADAIRNIFDAVFLEMLKLKPTHIGFVVGDSASNMKAAFKTVTERDGESAAMQVTFDESEDSEDPWVDLDSFFDDPEENDEDEEIDNSEIGPGINLDVDEWQSTGLQKLPCFSHLDQLIIKDAVKKSTAVCTLVNDIKAVKSYLHRSPPSFDSLKKYAKKGLVNQADTRWNTLFGVLDRLTEDSMQDALNRVLEESRATKNPCKIIFTAHEYRKMVIVKNLIKPLVDSTNILQSDKVTSSLIIPTIVCAYKAISLVDVSRDEDMDLFKGNLLEGMKERYSAHAVSSAESSGDTNQITRLKRITRCEIFCDRRLIAASILDPRFKSSPFAEPSFELNRWTCTEATAIEVVENMMAELPSMPSDEASSSAPLEDDPAEPSTSFFRFLKRAPPSAVTIRPQTDTTELGRYIANGCEDESKDPLDFWRSNALHFPRLAQLALKYLGFPASSGSVERLFSISGALQRSRRARLHWKTIEMLLCHRDERIAQLFGKSV